MKKELFLLGIILLGAFLLRLYRFDNPIADWHSWRQADTSAVSRNFVTNGFDLLNPRFDDISNVPSGKNNPEGYRFVEFPLYNAAQGGLFSLFNAFTLEQWGRLVTIFASIISTIFIYLIVLRHADRVVALSSAFFFGVLPYNVFYGRVLLPDPSMTMAFLGSIYFFNLWLDRTVSLQTQKRLYFSIQNFSILVLSIVLAASALLLKPFAVFFLLPLVVLAYQSFGFSLFKKWYLYVFAFFTILPLLLWRWWMQQYPEGIPVNEWLFNGGNIRFKGAFFYWIFADRISRLILGYFGLVPFFLGVIAIGSRLFVKEKKDVLFLFSFLLSSIIYIFTIARGNVQHDYYQIPIMPSVTILLGFGTAFLLRPLASLNKSACNLLLIVCVVGSLLFSWYHVRDYFNINNPHIVTAGRAVDQLTPKDAKIITFYDGDTSFLYHTKRKGWASLQASIPEMKILGATHLAIVNPTDKDREGLGQEFSVIASTSEYLILQLTP